MGPPFLLPSASANNTSTSASPFGPDGSQKSKPTVLVVDDDSSVRHSIGRVLTTEALHVVMARGVKDALDHILRNPPDLVMTDLCMVPLSGWDLIMHLKNSFPALPIFVISALPLESAGKAGRAAAEFFQKPLDLDLLLVAIRRHLGTSGADAIPSPAQP
jgi:DNA-binding NtrC family response regulator